MWSWLIMFGSVVAVILAVGHLWTYNRDTDAMGAPEADYRKFLGKRKPAEIGIDQIPLPPGGKRDHDVEALLKRGRLGAARELLVQRMEEARMAPVGSEQKIARVSYYMAILNQLQIRK